LEKLKLHKDHPSAEMIFNGLKDEFPSLTLVTVYNTLQRLELSGLCMKINPLHSSARYDGNTITHQHATCTNRQKIVDVHDSAIEIEPPLWLSASFNITSQSVNFYGICKDCQDFAEKRDETMKMQE